MNLYEKLTIPQEKSIAESWGRLNKNRTREWDLYGYDVGIHPLNMAIGGIVPTRLTVIGGRSGSGKAQTLTARVYTPEGYTTMGQLKVGDMVLSEKGVPVPVIGIYPQGIRPVYSLTMSDGTIVEADEDHLWKVYTAKDRKSIANAKIKTDKHSILTTKDMLGNERITMCKGRENVRNFKLPVCAPLQFSKKDFDIPPYALGALLGDGCFSRRSFSTNDFQILHRVVSELGGVANKTKGKSKCDYQLSKCRLRTRLVTTFNSLPRSVDKYIPQNYLYSTISDRIALLQGLMDTDGSINQDGTSSIFHTSSPQLAKDVVELVNGLGGIGSILNRGKKFYIHKNERKQSKHDAYDVVVNLPVEINPFYLERKAKLVKPKTIYKTPRYIEKIEFLCNAETRCISVGSETHLYVTDGCVVTHNTALTSPMFEAALRRKSDGSRVEFLFFTWELDPSIVIDRSICSKASLTLKQLNQGAKLLSEETMTTVKAAYTDISRYPITYHIHSTDINQVREVALEFIKRCRAKSEVSGSYIHPVICIDYLNMAQFESAGLRTYGIADFMNGLKQICNQEKASAIVFAQLSRETDKVAGKIPDRSDFSDSAAIENAADNLIVIYRPEYHNISTIIDPELGTEVDARGKMMIRVLKCRDYGIGDFLINCDIKHFRFWDNNQKFDHNYWLDYSSKDFWIKEFGLQPQLKQEEVPF